MTTSSSEARPAGLGARLAANPVAVDAFIALGLTALSILAIIGGAQDLGSYDPLSLVLLMLTTLPLLVRRRWPLAVFIVCFGATMGHAALARESLSTTLGFLVALFTDEPGPGRTLRRGRRRPGDERLPRRRPGQGTRRGSR